MEPTAKNTHNNMNIGTTIKIVSGFAFPPLTNVDMMIAKMISVGIMIAIPVRIKRHMNAHQIFNAIPIVGDMTSLLLPVGVTVSICKKGKINNIYYITQSPR